MPDNNIVLAQTYFGDPNNLLQVAVHPLLTRGILNENKTEIRWINAQTALVRVRGNYSGAPHRYDRNNGTAMNNVVGGWKPYTLNMELGDSVQVDIMDAEESKGMSIITEANQLVRTRWTPFVDKYNLYKLSRAAIVNSDPDKSATAAETVTQANILPQIDALLQAMFNNGIARTEAKYLYISSSAYTKLKQADKLTRFINVRTRQAADINTEVEYYNECEIVVVPSTYFGVFDAPQTQAEIDAGTAATTYDTTGIQYIIATKSYIISFIKFDGSKVLAPDVLAKLFAYQADMRMYFDLFPLLTVKADGTWPTNDEVVAPGAPAITACQGIAVSKVTPVTP